MTNDRISEIEERWEKISPTPWSYNGYSRVVSVPLMKAEDQRIEEGDLETPYEEDPDVCGVFPKYGDTAKPPHSNNAEAIAQAPSDIRYLLGLVRRQQEVVERADLSVAILETLVWQDREVENSLGMDAGEAVHAKAVRRLRHALDKLEEEDE